MSLKLYNSLTKTKEIFKPRTPGQINMYVCGNTVYDYGHLGHARSAIVFDSFIKFLKNQTYKVTYVRNITDVDDKIIKRAQETQTTCDSITQKFIHAMHEDEKALGVSPPDHEPQATAYMQQMIDLISKLEQEGFAYKGENDDIYFKIRLFKEYGKLSHRNLDQMIAGARIEISQFKQDPLDFVLWKKAKANEPSWESPWGLGRPGWHTECAAMSADFFDLPFDIHGGGLDLKFPHHENELTQCESAFKKTFVNYWMHVGLLEINHEKMAKSLGNVISIRTALKTYSAETLRFFMLSAHYRNPINYSEENLLNAQQSLLKFYLALRDLSLSQDYKIPKDNDFYLAFFAALNDDFNTPEAFSVLFALLREINRCKESNLISEANEFANILRGLTRIFGILQLPPEVALKQDSENTEWIEDLIAKRNQARLQKDWVLADQIRSELFNKGVILEDTEKGSLWRLK